MALVDTAWPMTATCPASILPTLSMDGQAVAVPAAAPEAADSPFRPAKRRKFYRRRAEDDDEEREASGDPASVAAPVSSAAAHGSSSAVEIDGDAPQPSVAEVLRLRKQGRPRKAIGIEFSTSHAPRPEAAREIEQAMATTDRDGTHEDGAVAVAHRFAPQTGQVADVNKHM